MELPTETELATGYVARAIADRLGYLAVFGFLTSDVKDGIVKAKLNINGEIRVIKVTVEIVED